MRLSYNIDRFMEKVVITGANGFIGRHLVKKLEKERRYKVFELDRKKNSLLDVNSLRELVDGTSIVYHLAGVNDSASLDLMNTNVAGTFNLLTALKEMKVRPRFIYISSFAVYKLPEKRGLIISEDYPIDPRNGYGLSKKLAEDTIKYFSDTYDIPATVLRVSNVYGPGVKPFANSVVATFMELVNSNKEIFVDGDGRQTRDFVFVNDVADALACLNKEKMGFEIYNVCSGEGISIKKLISLIELILGKQAKVIFRKKTKSSGGFWQGNGQRFYEEFGWKPVCGIKEGLKRTWEERDIK